MNRDRMLGISVEFESIRIKITHPYQFESKLNAYVQFDHLNSLKISDKSTEFNEI